MSNLRKIPVLAVVFLVTLRIFIGWQFFYEGVWKLKTLETARPWTSAGYLKNSQGPLRETFREMSGDPDDLNWLDAEAVSSDWENWLERFKQQHSDLSEDQIKRLDLLLDGPEEFVAKLDALPEGVEIRGSLGEVVRFDPDRQRLIVDGKMHLTPAERERLLRLVKVQEDPAEADLEKNEQAKQFQKAVRDVYKRSSRLSFNERLRASLVGDPERAGLIDESQEGTIDYKRLGQIELYQEQLARYEANRAKAEEAFQHDHLKKQWSDLQGLRAQLVGPIKALDAEFKEAAYDVLDTEQLASGPVPGPWQQIEMIDMTTIYGLVILGMLLIAGLFSRIAALGAAVLLLSFYLAMPPWPGVVDFQELPGPEHSYLIDKNLIEVCALLALACMPTGQWFGLDSFFVGFKARRRARSSASETREEPAVTAAAN